LRAGRVSDLAEGAQGRVAREIAEREAIDEGRPPAGLGA